jgi:hypothetical protein
VYDLPVAADSTFARAVALHQRGDTGSAEQLYQELGESLRRLLALAAEP